jgi:SAM-dependent methyltransferase
LILEVRKGFLMEAGFKKYADGRTLYGDDFVPDQIEAWFRDEQEAYYKLAEKRTPGEYGYHALNWRHGFRHLPPTRFEHILGIGSAFGDELRPVLGTAKKVTILEPSDGFANPKFRYIKPNADGSMPFAADTFDLVTCFGVLHHIPNVSTVMRELSRCTKPGGWLLVREPTHSMGDWDRPRRGLTRRERGIPLPIIRRMVADAGLQIAHQRRCMFSLTARLQPVLPKNQAVYNTPWLTAFDDYICNVPIWSEQYHPNNFFQRFRPWAVFLVLHKPA